MKEVKTTDPNDSLNPRTVLLAGGIGTGKTPQFLTLPGRKFLYVFDPNCLESIRAMGGKIEYVEFIPDITDIDLSAKTLMAPDKQKVVDRTSVQGLEPKTYRDWQRDFEERAAAHFFDDYDWVGLDSFTTFSDCVLDRIMYMNGRLGKHPEQADQTALMSVTKNVYRVFSGMNGFFSTAHTETYKDDITGRIYGRILMTGRNRIRIPLLFANIFTTYTEADAKGVRYMIKTVPDREDPVIRTCIPGLKPVEDVTIDRTRPLEGQGIGRIILAARGHSGPTSTSK